MSTSECTLCPRNCKIDRNSSIGFCGAPPLPQVAKAMLHRWEEPCICYGNGSGAVFFSGCQLKCVFCQNHQISTITTGKELREKALYDLFFHLAKQGACNINLVSPTPYLETIIPALSKAKKDGLAIPVVFNSGGYESVESLRKLDGLIDVYLPDFKFFSADLSLRYAKAKDYPDHALRAILEMHRQTGTPLLKNGRLLRGIIVRHLILPNCSGDSIKILELLSEHLPKDGIILSLMRQYTPMVDPLKFPELSRPITSLEYSRVIKKADDLGFTYIYTQSKHSVGEEFVPDFSIFFDEKN